MKKLFSLVSIFVVVFALSGCAATTDLQSELEAKETLITALQEEVASLETTNETSEATIDDLQATIEELEAQIIELQELLFDNLITITLLDEYGRVVSDTIGFDDDYDGSLFDLLVAEFEVLYFDTDYGKYITDLGHLHPKEGAYISFSKNSEMSMVGVELATFEDGDSFTFEVMWWDTLQEQVDDAIQLFLGNQIDTYVNETTLDYSVVSALHLLGVLEEYITTEEVVSYVDSMTLTTIYDYEKAIILLDAVSADTTSLVSALNDMATVGGYGQTANALIGLLASETTVDYSTFEVAALLDLESTTPYDLGLDAGGISVVALSQLDDQSALIDPYLTWVSESILETGGIQTRDMSWGETVYPGTENAATIAQVIMALVSVGENPTATVYSNNNLNLITRLLEFQTDTGSFDYVLTDDLEEDLMFSTPQAFLALVTYQTYVNTYGAVFPY